MFLQCALSHASNSTHVCFLSHVFAAAHKINGKLNIYVGNCLLALARPVFVICVIVFATRLSASCSLDIACAVNVTVSPPVTSPVALITRAVASDAAVA